MANDQKNFSPMERNMKLKSPLQIQRLANNKNVGSNFFTSKNKGKKLLHIGVKH